MDLCVKESNLNITMRHTLCIYPTIQYEYTPTQPESIRKDEFWIKAMDEKLDQIEKNDTRELVPRPKNKNVINTKWVFKNKLNEYGQVIGNKARSVCKGYAQIERIDFEETFAQLP